jgi:hypothetical protein
MGLREQLNDNPRITTGITVVIIVVVLAWLLWPRGGGGAAGGGGGASVRAFYTSDDGKTWFPDDARKLPPFKKDGKDAVRAIVFRCGGKTFVNHMERYTADTQKKLETIYAKGDAGGANDPSLIGPIREEGLEVKSPDGKDWVKLSDAKAQQVMKPKCPGDGADLVVVQP